MFRDEPSPSKRPAGEFAAPATGRSQGLLATAAGSAWSGVRAFAATLAIVGVLGVVLAGVSFFLLRRDPYVAAVAAVVALIESLVTGFLLAGKLGLFAAIAQGLRGANPAGALFGAMFDRLLEVGRGEPMGERGTLAAQVAERIPLAQAERRLRNVVVGLVGSQPQTAESGIVAKARRWIRRGSLRRIEKYTLAQFRDDAATTGGVDLHRVREHLEGKIDALLVGKLKAGVNLWTAGVMLGLPLAVAVQTWIALAWLGK